MGFAFILIGLVLIITGANNKVELFTDTVKDDLSGFSGFFLAILLIAALGAVKPLKGVSDGFLILVFLVLFLRSDTGVFDQLKTNLQKEL